MAYENRFEQYDIYMERPAPLVPRHLRLPVTERMNSRRQPLIPLDYASVLDLVPTLDQYGVQALAVGLLPDYANTAPEIPVPKRLKSALPCRSFPLGLHLCPQPPVAG